MSFFEKDKNALAGNSIIVGNVTFTWDETEPVNLKASIPSYDSDAKSQTKDNTKAEHLPVE